MMEGNFANMRRIELLNQDNYRSWAQDMKVLLRQENVWGLIDENIYHHVASDKKQCIADCDTPLESWNKLKDIYEPSSRARKARMRREFLNLKLESGKEMAVFLSRVDIAAKQLEDLKETVSDAHKAYQYLDYLPDEYQQAVFSIYHWIDAEFTSQKVSLQLLAEYSCLKNVHGHIERRNEDSKALRTEINRNPNYGQRKSDFYCYNCGISGHIARKCVHPRKQRDKSYNRMES
uniref:CCHC-type domain-containing protein n=1 Tax=Strigamia maritima TaxID=126957 RepID=T1IH73_STRMM